MNKFLIGVAAVVTVGALVLIGCPDDSTGNGGSSEFTQLGNCEAPASGNNSVFRVYADGDYTACNTLALAAGSPFSTVALSPEVTFTEVSGGANGTSKALRLDVPVAAGLDQDTRGVITLNEDVDVSGKALRFNIKSPTLAEGGTSLVRVRLEADIPPGMSETSYITSAVGSSSRPMFVNDGTWQEVVINIDSAYDFSQPNITAATVRAIRFQTPQDTNGGADGLGVKTFDIDEVRFEEIAPNCTAPAASTAASVDLIWGDAVYNNCDAISTGFYGAAHVPTRDAANRPRSPFTFASNALGNGASGSPLFTNITLGSGNSIYAYGIADFPADYNATGKALNFSIKSPAAGSGGVGSIDIFLEGTNGGPNARTVVVNQRFTNDGTWQPVSVPITSFISPASGVSRSNVRRVVFSLVDSDGFSSTGVGAQTLDIDEIRFEDTCKAPTSGNADITLVFGEGNYASCAQAALAANNALGVYNSASDSITDVLFTEEYIGTGANGTNEYYRVQVADASLTYAGAYITLNEGIDITGKTLKFSLRSPATGGNGKIRVYIQDTAATPEQNTNTEAIVTFTQGTAWEDVSIDVDTTFVGNTSLLKTSIGIIGFDIQDTDAVSTNGRGLQLIDIDEIRFE